MKTLFKIYLLLLFSLVTGFEKSEAQMCQNSTDTLYGLNSVSGTSGQITAINVNNAGTTNIGTAASGSVNANGIGFSEVDGRFYFFNQCGSGTIEFISYDPITGVKIGLTNPPATVLGTHKIRSGTITNGGNGYYTINPNATYPYFYYYNIALNSWTTITSTFVSRTGATITDFKNLNSGDMAFDGKGNLWLLVSNSTEYALYRINAPVPTTAVASIVADTMVSRRANPISGVSFTGIGFNSKGVLYLTTGSGAGAGNNKLYKQSTVLGTVTLVGSVPNGVGDDLTSCIFPVAVLPLRWLEFSADPRGRDVLLHWSVNEYEAGSVYRVEYSTDGIRWQTISTLTGTPGDQDESKQYSFLHRDPGNARCFYRVVGISAAGKETVSAIRIVNREDLTNLFSLFPNPASASIILENRSVSTQVQAQILDMSGRVWMSVLISAGRNTIQVQTLPAGLYLICLKPADAMVPEMRLRFIKK